MPNGAKRDDTVVTQLLKPQSAANTAAATTPSGSWVDISNYVGDVEIHVNVGTLTGSVTVQAQVGTDNTGAAAQNCVDSRGTATASISAAGIAKLVINTDGQPSNFIGIVGTVVTGPVLIGVSMGGYKSIN